MAYYSITMNPLSRPSYCPDLVFVNGGTFHMGSLAKPVEQPIIQVTVPSFWIGMYLVTYDEFKYFCEETGHALPDQTYQAPGRPITTICWYESQVYVDWLSQKTGRKFRLPSESE